jgi:Na+-driven multidrug efflux pump
LQISLIIYLGNQLNIIGISLAVVIALTAQALVLTIANIRLKNVQSRRSKPNDKQT